MTLLSFFIYNCLSCPEIDAQKSNNDGRERDPYAKTKSKEKKGISCFVNSDKNDSP